MDYTPDDELDELIKAGYGDMRRERIPPDWRTRKPATKEASEYFGAKESRLTLAQAVMDNEAQRSKGGRPKGTGGKKQTAREVRVAWKAAAMRARIKKARKTA